MVEKLPSESYAMAYATIAELALMELAKLGTPLLVAARLYHLADKLAVQDARRG